MPVNHCTVTRTNLVWFCHQLGNSKVRKEHKYFKIILEIFFVIFAWHWGAKQSYRGALGVEIRDVYVAM
jgi:hypothetical protein